MAETNQPQLEASPSIDGVFIVHLKAFADPRGQFMETFRREWFSWINWERMQSNASDSKAGVLRGLHYHFHQIDYWVVANGTIRAAMVDLRPASPTHRATLTVEMGEEHPIGLFIPSGVAHGFAALTDCKLIYIVNNYYDGGKDELGLAWDDPDIAVDWGIERPMLSGRDLNNPRLRDIPPEKLPR